MKKIFITILLAALMPFAAGAQDARQRTAETIVADALAQLPAQTPKAFDSLMQELAATGADGIRMMAAMLVPAAEGKNAPVEYAINGVVSYVTAAGREELAREIRAGLTDAVTASTDKPNQAFLLSQLQLCATAAEAPVFVKYAADEYLADYAVRGLISTPGTDGEILALIDASPAPDALLAYAAAEKRLAAAEPALLKWAADPKTGTPTKEAVYNALAKCGTAASIAPLAAAAKADGYAFTKTDATGAYVALLARLAAAGNSKAVAAAKALRKTGMPQNIRIAGLEIALRADAKKRTQEVLAALKDPDRTYRCAALDCAAEFADIVVRTTSSGEQIRLGDIAEVSLGSQTYGVSSSYESDPTAMIVIYQQPGSNAVAVGGKVKAAMERLSQRFPDGVEAATIVDSTTSIDAGVKDIFRTLVIALILVILIIFLFLQDWRATVIPLVAIPVSLVGAFALFPLLGFSINIISLLGLVLAIGLVVDDAIVVVEAAQVNIERGMKPREAALEAMRNVASPIVATTVVLLAVFIPVSFTGGITGRLFQQFSVTIAVSVVISAFNALTLSPALCVLLLKPRKEARKPIASDHYISYSS